MNHVEVKIVNGKFTPMLYADGRVFQLAGFHDYDFAEGYAKALSESLKITYKHNSKLALTGKD